MNPHELESLYQKLKEEDPSPKRGESLWDIFEQATDTDLRPLALWTFSQNQFDLGHFRSFLTSFSMLTEWIRKDAIQLPEKEMLDLFWNFKSYLIFAAEQFDMPVATIEQDFKLFSDFCEARGFSRTKDYVGFVVYSKLGEEDKADELLESWVDLDPDELSDCPSCEAFSRMTYAIERGFDQRALFIYAALRHEKGCSRMPEQAHPYILPLFMSELRHQENWTAKLIEEVRAVKPDFTGGDAPYHLYAELYYVEKPFWSMQEMQSLIPFLTDRGYLQLLIAHYLFTHRTSRRQEVAYLTALRANAFEVAKKLDQRVENEYYVKMTEREIERIHLFVA